MDALVIVRDSALFRAWACPKGALASTLVGFAAGVAGSHLHITALAVAGIVFACLSLLSLVMSSIGDAYARVRQQADPDCPYGSWFIFFELVFNPANIIPILQRHASRARAYFVIRDYIFFGRKTYFIKSEELIHTILVSSASSFDKAQTGNEVYGLYSLLDGGETEAWRHRHNLAPYFRNGIEGARPMVEQITEDHIKQWRSMRDFELLPAVFRLVLRIHLTSFFNYAPSDSDLDYIMECGSYFVAMPNMQTKKAREMLFDFHTHMLNALNGSKPGTLGGIMNEMVAEGRMSKDEARANTGMIFLALTPVFAIFWSIVNIAFAGHFVQTRAREEPEYLEACIKETLRMYPPVPNMYVRKATEDVTADGVTISKDSQVVIFPLWVHHDSRLWLDPASFNPDRFANQPSILDEKSGAATSANGHNVNMQNIKKVLNNTQSAHANFRPATHRHGDHHGHHGHDHHHHHHNNHHHSHGHAQNQRRRSSGEMKRRRGSKENTHHDGKTSTPASPSTAASAAPTSPVAANRHQDWSARFIPFGLGKHQCLGRHFAVMELKVVVGTLLKHSFVDITEDNGLLELPIVHRLASKGAAYFYPARSVHVHLSSLAVVRARALARSLCAMGLLASRVEKVLKEDNVQEILHQDSSSKESNSEHEEAEPAAVSV